jgi:hypothetical protein
MFKGKLKKVKREDKKKKNQVFKKIISLLL